MRAIEKNPCKKYSLPAKTLTLLAALVGNAATAQAACNTYIATPADGIIAAGATVSNSQHDTCFQNASVPITNYGTINNNESGYAVSNIGALTNTATGKINNAGVLTNNVGATLTNNGTFDNRIGNAYGAFSNQGTLINNGTFNNSGSLSDYVTVGNATIINSGAIHNTGSMWIAQGASLTGTGTVDQSGPNAYMLEVDGVLTQSSVAIASGRLTGSGTINGAVSLTGGILGLNPGGASVFAQLPERKLTINGSLSMTNATMSVDIYTPEPGYGAQWAYGLDVTGPITLSGNNTLAFNFGWGISPTAGASFKFLTGDTSGLSLSGLSLVFSNMNGTYFDPNLFKVTNVNDGLMMTVLAAPTPPVSNVPAPAAAWLFGSGLIGLIGAARRKDARA